MRLTRRGLLLLGAAALRSPEAEAFFPHGGLGIGSGGGGSLTLVTNNPFTIRQGGTTTVNNLFISATSGSQTPSQITYTITSGPSHGSFIRPGVGSISSFTQADMNANVLQYQHNGSATTSDAMGITVADTLGHSQPFTFSILIDQGLTSSIKPFMSGINSSPYCFPTVVPTGLVATYSIPAAPTVGGVYTNANNFTMSEATGTNLGTYTDALMGGAFTVTCVECTNTSCPDVKMRIYREGSNHCLVEFMVENYTGTVAAPAYTVTLTGSGGFSHTFAISSHPMNTSWPVEFGKWHHWRTAAQLHAAGLTPQFDGTLGTSDVYWDNQAAQPWTAFASYGVVKGMGQTGERNEIGAINDCVGWALCTDDDYTWQSAVNFALVSLSVNWHWLDPTSRAPLDFVNTYPSGIGWNGSQSPTVWELQNSTFNLTLANSTGSPITVAGCGLNANILGLTVTDSVTGGVFYLIGNPGDVVVPANGTASIALTDYPFGPNGMPTGTPLLSYTNGQDSSQHGSVPSGISVQGSYQNIVVASGWVAQSGHMACLVNIVALATGHPIFIREQQLIYNAGFLVRRNWSFGLHMFAGDGNTRNLAWQMRDVFWARVLSPTTAPSWLQAKSVPAAFYEQWLTDALSIITNTTRVRTVFFIFDDYLNSIDDGDGGGASGYWWSMWQLDYWHWTLYWMGIIDSRWLPVVQFCMKNCYARLGDDGTGHTNGWPGLDGRGYQIANYFFPISPGDPYGGGEAWNPYPPKSIASATWASGTLTLTVTDAALGLPVGSQLNLSLYGADQSGFNASAITCTVTGTQTMTASLANPGAASATSTMTVTFGSTVVNISSITWSAGTATITTATPHGQVGTVSGIVNNAFPAWYNSWSSAYSMTVTGANTLTYALALANFFDGRSAVPSMRYRPTMTIGQDPVYDSLADYWTYGISYIYYQTGAPVVNLTASCNPALGGSFEYYVLLENALHGLVQAGASDPSGWRAQMRTAVSAWLPPTSNGQRFWKRCVT